MNSYEDTKTTSNLCVCIFVWMCISVCVILFVCCCIMCVYMYVCVCVCVLDNKRMCRQTEAALMCLLSTVSIACILTDRQPTTL